MRVGSIHEPPTRVDVTRIPTERETQDLRRHSDHSTPLRPSHVDDDGRDEEETPDNATTDDEDDQCLAAAHAASVDDTADHKPDSEPENDMTETSHQSLNEHEESSHDADPPSTKLQTTIQKKRWNHGLTT